MKAQISVEMLMILSALGVLFVFAFGVFGNQATGVTNARDSMDAYRIASGIGAAFNSVALAGDGTRAELDVFQGSGNVNATIEGRTLIVYSGKARYSWPLMTNNTDSTYFPIGAIAITNTNGMISIESA